MNEEEMLAELAEKISADLLAGEAYVFANGDTADLWGLMCEAMQDVSPAVCKTFPSGEFNLALGMAMQRKADDWGKTLAPLIAKKAAEDMELYVALAKRESGAFL